MAYLPRCHTVPRLNSTYGTSPGLALEPQVFVAGDYILREGELGSDMYLNSVQRSSAQLDSNMYLSYLGTSGTCALVVTYLPSSLVIALLAWHVFLLLMCHAFLRMTWQVPDLVRAGGRGHRPALAAH